MKQGSINITCIVRWLWHSARYKVMRSVVTVWYKFKPATLKNKHCLNCDCKIRAVFLFCFIYWALWKKRIFFSERRLSLFYTSILCEHVMPNCVMPKSEFLTITECPLMSQLQWNWKYFILRLWMTTELLWNSMTKWRYSYNGRRRRCCGGARTYV
jgi:hypothetical protein